VNAPPLRPGLEELVALYAMDALEGDEAALVRRALASDAGLARQLAEHHEVLAVLAQAVESAPSTPSPSVWERIQAGVSGADVRTEAPTFTPRRQLARRRWTNGILGAVAVAAVVVAGLLGVQRAQAPQPGDLEAAADELAGEPGTEVLELQGASGIGVTVVLGADGVGYVTDSTLPELAPDRTYQLWAINDNGVISAGILGAAPSTEPFRVDGPMIGFAVTEEIAGGVVTSENEPVAVWLADA
jgi:anti-sigma-K factor RskA